MRKEKQQLTLEFVNNNFYEIGGKVFRKDGKHCANTLKIDGYLYISFKNAIYSAHRLLWILYNQKDIPDGLFVDHIDGNRSNNSKDNLRLATRSENNQNSKISKNNKFGYKGIKIIKIGKYSYYKAQIWKEHKLYTKTFPYTNSGLLSAKEWLDSMRKELHGEFARYE